MERKSEMRLLGLLGRLNRDQGRVLRGDRWSDFSIMIQSTAAAAKSLQSCPTGQA